MPETNTFKLCLRNLWHSLTHDLWFSILKWWELTLGNEDRVFKICWWWVIVVHLIRYENKVPVWWVDRLLIKMRPGDKGVSTKRSNISLNGHARNASEVEWELLYYLWSIEVPLNHSLGMSTAKQQNWHRQQTCKSGSLVRDTGQHAERCILSELFHSSTSFTLKLFKKMWMHYAQWFTRQTTVM